MPAPVLAPDPNLLLVGKGEVYFDRYSATPAKQGYLHLGNCESFEITSEPDSIEKKSSMSAPAPTYKKVARSNTVKLKIVSDEFNLDNVALATLGDTSEVTQAATPVVGEVMSTSITKGRYYKTAKYGPITAVVAKKAPSTVLTLGTDYQITDATLGIIRILSTAGAIANGDGLNIDYTPSAYVAGTGIQTVRGGNKSLIEGGFLFDPDPSSGPKIGVQVWRTSLIPTSAVALISEEFGTLELEATVLDDSAGLFGGSANEPLYRMSYLP